MKLNIIEVNFSPLYEVTSNDKALSLKLLNLIYQSLGELSSNIKEAYFMNDLKQVSHFAHKLKSSIAYIKVSDFTQLLVKLEGLKQKEMSSEDLTPTIHALISNAEEIRAIVFSEIQQLNQTSTS